MDNLLDKYGDGDGEPHKPAGKPYFHKNLTGILFRFFYDLLSSF